MTPAAYWHARAASWRARAAQAGEDASLPGIGALGRTLARRRARDAAAMAIVLDGLADPGRCHGGCTFWHCARPRGHAGPCQPSDVVSK